jgi:hypothetical protein
MQINYLRLVAFWQMLNCCSAPAPGQPSGNPKLRHLSPAARENRPSATSIPATFPASDRERTPSSNMICSLDNHLNRSGIQHGFRLILNSLLLLTALLWCFIPVLR